MNKGRVLAVDYGGAKVGLAVSDQDRQMAFGRGVLRGLAIEAVLDVLVDLVSAEQVVQVVVGLPLAIDGQETQQTLRIREFGKRLAERLGNDVVLDYIDESFSTFEANEILTKIGVDAEQRRATEDEMAAIVLLQRYIDFKL